nr:MAG TPA: receptor binding complex [Caudoviricetes sp.]
MPDISSSLSKREVNARQNTYTKSEIDLKDGAIQAIAEAAQTTADAAEKKNQEQDQLIAELQKSSHSHSNQDVLDKTEQPYTTAERDKLAGLENYTHPTHTAHKKEFYKFASDGEGHVTDAEKVTASDLYNAGGVIQSALNLYDYRGYIPLSFMTLYYGGGLKNIAEILFLDRDSNKQREIRLCLGSYNDRSTGCLNLVDYNGCQYILEPNPDSPGTQAYIFYFPKQSGTIALTKDIPDISGKQDKSTAVTHTANTAVGSTAKPVYIAADGKATPIMHSINSDVPANAKFTDTTYSDATQSAHGLMTAADKKKLDGMDLSKYLPLHGTADQSKALSNGSMRYGWCVNNAANADSGYRWFRIGTLALSKLAFDTETMYLHVCSGYGKYGVLCVYTRIDSTGVGVQTIRLSWLNKSAGTLPPKFKLVGIGASDGVKFELWCYTPSRWESVAYYVVADLKLTGGLLNRWLLEKHSDPDAKSATTVGTTSVTDVDLSYAAKANEAATLTDSGWINCPLAVTGNTTYPTSASTIRVRKYGKMVKLEGWVKYSTAFNKSHDVATIPAEYRPENPMHLNGVQGSGGGTKIVFHVLVSPYGLIHFSPADTSNSATFNPAADYEFQATYFID